MVNNLLMLIKLDADTMAFASLLVSIVGALAAIFAAYYASVAAFYAKKAVSRRDLTPVEPDTEPVEHFSNKILSIDTQRGPQAPPEVVQAEPEEEARHSPAVGEVLQVQPEQEVREPQIQQEVLQVQPQQEVPKPEAQRISISVEGEAMGEVPLELFLTLEDLSMRVSRVETLNGAGKALSSSPSKATDDALVFKSILAPKKVSQWWSAGESTSEGGGRSFLRVYLLVDGSKKEIYRDVPVSIVEELRSVGIASMVVWTIKGSN